ncbi:MAG: protein kinase family protein [Clostridia bacterium]|nr:protein kinase family protein [Clostridia bacterium]
MENEIINFIKTKSYTMVNAKLGKGSCGQTVLLRDNSLEELFVCKKYLPQEGVNIKYFYDMFKKEIKIMYKLNNPNIVRIYNYYLYDEYNAGFILMEYIDGETIDKYLSKKDIEIDANSIFIQLINAFNCLEKNNIIHRDIRPNNIMIDKNGVVKIIDFGLGKDFSESSMSKDSLNKVIDRRGMEKIPSEINVGKYTSKTDMFCLAELFSRLLKKNSLNNFEYKTILNKMLETDPSKRFASFEDILNKINHKELTRLDITEKDKEIYLNFSSSMILALDHHSSEQKINDNVDEIINGLENLLEENCLENVLIENSSLISIFVKNNYAYSNGIRIETALVKDFLNWFERKDRHFQEIVIKSIKAKLSKVKVKIDEDLPF